MSSAVGVLEMANLRQVRSILPTRTLTTVQSLRMEFSRGEFVFVSWLSDLCWRQRPLLTVSKGYDAARRLGVRSAAMLCVRAYVVFKAWVKLLLSSSRTSDSWWVPGSRGDTMPPAVVPVFLACASTRVAEFPA